MASKLSSPVLNGVQPKADEALLRDVVSSPPAQVGGIAEDVVDPRSAPIIPEAKPKLTRKVRRGLALMRGLLLDAFKDDAPPASTITARWPKYLQDDFNTGMAWIEGHEERSR